MYDLRWWWETAQSAHAAPATAWWWSVHQAGSLARSNSHAPTCPYTRDKATATMSISGLETQIDTAHMRIGSAHFTARTQVRVIYMLLQPLLPNSTERRPPVPCTWQCAPFAWTLRTGLHTIHITHANLSAHLSASCAGESDVASAVTPELSWTSPASAVHIAARSIRMNSSNCTASPRKLSRVNAISKSSGARRESVAVLVVVVVGVEAEAEKGTGGGVVGTVGAGVCARTTMRLFGCALQWVPSKSL